MTPTLNPIRPQNPRAQHAVFVDPHSAVFKSEIDMLNRTFRIQLFAHPKVVSGPVVVNRTSQRTGK